MQSASDRWISVGLALLLHGLLLVAALYGWMLFRSAQPPKPTLAIEATVVDARTVAGLQRPAPPAPPPPAPAPQEPPAEQGPPPPTPAERAERERQRQEERQKAEAAATEKAAAQKAATEKAEQQAAQAKAAEEARKAEEQKKAEAQKKAAEAKAAQEKKAQEAALAKQKADEAAEAAEAAEEEADLKRSLANEERAASAGPALAKWQAQIAARIERAWIRPPTARPGIQCILYVTQERDGTVTQVRVGDCNGDQAVRQSVEQAAYRASPLPPPPDPSLFERELTLHFTPD
jgi:colicin import membrane protein